MRKKFIINIDPNEKQIEVAPPTCYELCFKVIKIIYNYFYNFFSSNKSV